MFFLGKAFGNAVQRFLVVCYAMLCYVMLCSMIFGNLLCFFIIVFAGFIAIFLWALPDTNKD